MFTFGNALTTLYLVNQLEAGCAQQPQSRHALNTLRLICACIPLKVVGNEFYPLTQSRRIARGKDLGSQKGLLRRIEDGREIFSCTETLFYMVWRNRSILIFPICSRLVPVNIYLRAVVD